SVGGGRGERRLDVELRDAEQPLAFGELAREVLLPGVDLAPQLVAPRGGTVAPRLHEVLPPAARRHRERAGEHVVAARLERSALEPALTGLAVENGRAEDVVAVADHRRRDVDGLADGSLDRE